MNPSCKTGLHFLNVEDLQFINTWAALESYSRYFVLQIIEQIWIHEKINVW